MKKKSLNIIIIGILFLLIGIAILFWNSSNKDKMIKKNNINTIKEKYITFEEELKNFNKNRETISNMSNNYNEEQIVYEYSTWIDNFDNYSNSLEKIESYREMISNICLNKKYKDTNIQSKCDSMIINFETTTNYYVKDVMNLNKFIDQYNEKEQKNKKEKYDLKSRDYIDINDDGKYLGK